jgi:hypothetical protein
MNEAAAAAPSAKKAREQKELNELLNLIPGLGELSSSIGYTTLAVTGENMSRIKLLSMLKKALNVRRLCKKK